MRALLAGLLALGLGGSAFAQLPPPPNVSNYIVIPTTGGSPQPLRDLMNPVNTWITSMTGLQGANGLYAPLNFSVGTGVSWDGTYTITNPGTGCHVNDYIGAQGGHNQHPTVWQVDTVNSPSTGIATMHMLYGGWYTPPLVANPQALGTFGGPNQGTCTSARANFNSNGVVASQSSFGMDLTGTPLSGGAYQGSHARIDANGVGIIDLGSHDLLPGGAPLPTVGFLLLTARNSAGVLQNYESIDLIAGSTVAGSETGRYQFALDWNGAAWQELMVGRGLLVGCNSQPLVNLACNFDGPGLGTIGAYLGYAVGSPSPGPGYTQIIDGSKNATLASVTSTTAIGKASGGIGGTTGRTAATTLSHPYVLCNSNAAAPGSPLTGTGANSETNFATCTIPANAIGLGSIRVTTLWQFTGTANTKIMVNRLNTTSGAVTGGMLFLNVAAAAANLNAECQLSVYNRTTGSQIGREADQCAPAAASGSLPSGSIDTTSTSYININGSVTNTNDSIQLQAYRVVLYPVGGN